jgi:uncharacterized protein YndB with AHSA1/START domain
MQGTADREIVTARVLNVRRELVFKAWTDADHLARWWGPKGFTNTFQEFDVRPGGAWRYVMHGPNGGDYKNESVFVEIVKPERIVFRHVSPPHFLAMVTLADEDGKTRLTWRMLFDSAGERDKLERLVVEGNEQNLSTRDGARARQAVTPRRASSASRSSGRVPMGLPSGTVQNSSNSSPSGSLA